MTQTLAAAMLLWALFAADLPGDFTLPAPPGAFVGPAKPEDAKAAGFHQGDPLIATTYFYWYDVNTRAHVVNGNGSDALTDHPPTLEGFSYKNVDWHARQLADMIAAGIDVALPVYWGVPGWPSGWSNEGLPKLVAARERLLAEGKTPPAIGMFYDTSTLRHNGKGYHVDLTTPAGRLWFYGTIRDFFSLIPPPSRALIDGRPLVVLYSPGFAKKVDEELFPAVRKMFRADFGSDLYLVKMLGWPGKADSQYEWGAALRPRILDTAGLGPGYDHSAVPGRKPLVRKREGGQFYAGAWKKLLAMHPARRPWLVHLETWNELHEGTELCETSEYGRQYIELTRRFADQFHRRQRIDPAGGRPVPAVISAMPGRSEGLRIVPRPEGDGPIVEQTVEGKAAWSTTQNRFSPKNRYIYFEVDDAFLFDGDEPVEVCIGYFDAGPKEFRVDYDSSDPSVRGTQQQFRAGAAQPIQGSKTWKEVAFVIPHARFVGRVNGADFRLACTDADLSISHVSMRRPARN
jgi:hypothetical protein